MGLTLGLVPARSGSKGVPGKNLKKLGPRSLLAHAIEVGQKAGLDVVALSTDSDAYIKEGQRYGASVIRRPRRLARDTTPMLDVITHAVEQIEKTCGKVTTVVLLQPTSPFRKPSDVKKALKLLEKNRADSVVSVVRVPDHFNPCTMMMEREGELYFPLNPGYRYSRRQDMPPAYLRNGCLYVFRRRLLKRKKPTLFGRHCLKYPMPDTFHVNIDAPADLKRARQLYARWVSGR